MARLLIQGTERDPSGTPKITRNWPRARIFPLTMQISLSDEKTRKMEFGDRLKLHRWIARSMKSWNLRRANLAPRLAQVWTSPHRFRPAITSPAQLMALRKSLERTLSTRVKRF